MVQHTNSVETGPPGHEPFSIDGFSEAVKGAVKTALVVHCLLIPLFYFIGAIPLAVFNIASVAIYVTGLRLLKRNRLKPALGLIWFEVVAHTCLAVASLGWDSGFQYYIFILIAFVFINAYRTPANRILLSSFLCALYIALDIVMRSTAPLFPTSEGVLAFLRYANIMFSFAFYGQLSFLYGRTVKRAHAQLAAIAATDPLTGLYNRRHFMNLAQAEANRSRRSGKTFALIIGDIDDFKVINDQYGHKAGDHVLVQVSEQLRRSLRSQDVVARWGGEEFLALLPETDLNGAQAMAERIRKALNAQPLEFDDARNRLSITFGVCVHRSDETIGESIARSDRAMYKGKKAGKNCVVAVA